VDGDAPRRHVRVWKRAVPEAPQDLHRLRVTRSLERWAWRT
jgi:hypothetical protein